MLRDNLAGLIEPTFSSAGAYPLALCTDQNESSDDRPPNALKIPARQGGIYALTENSASPLHAEPRHIRLQHYQHMSGSSSTNRAGRISKLRPRTFQFRTVLCTIENSVPTYFQILRQSRSWA